MTIGALRHAAWIGCFVAMNMAAAALAQCPDGCIRFGTGGTACGSATSRDSTFNSGPDTYHASYDITLGKISNELTSSNFRSSSVTVTDVFRIVGAPPGPPIQLQARLATSGVGASEQPSGNIFAETLIGLEGPSFITTFASFISQVEGHITLVVNIMVSPEEPFTVTLIANSYTRSQTVRLTRAEGTLSFANIPAGASIVSCGGYSTDNPVPARKSTWGRLKSLYR